MFTINLKDSKEYDMWYHLDNYIKKKLKSKWPLKFYNSDELVKMSVEENRDHTQLVVAALLHNEFPKIDSVLIAKRIGVNYDTVERWYQQHKSKWKIRASCSRIYDLQILLRETLQMKKVFQRKGTIPDSLLNDFSLRELFEEIANRGFRLQIDDHHPEHPERQASSILDKIYHEAGIRLHQLKEDSWDHQKHPKLSGQWVQLSLQR